MGHIYLLEEKLDDAERLLSAILANQPNATDDDHYHNAIIREKLACLALWKGHYDEAISHCDAVIEVYDQLLPELHPHRLESLQIAGIAQIALHHYSEARQLIDRAVKLRGSNSMPLVPRNRSGSRWHLICGCGKFSI